MLSGNEALARALGSSRLRASYGFVGVPLHRFVDALVARPAGGVTHRPTYNDLHAASLALGGALLSGGGTCLILRAGGLNVALEALATLGLLSELRAPVVIVAGYDSGPLTAATAQDDRGTLAYLCRLPQLEPGSPDELYHMTRLAAQASRLSGSPVVVRVGSRVLDATSEVRELPPDSLDGKSLGYARSAGPYLLSSATYRYHVDKRARRIQQLEPLAAALATQIGEDGAAGVVLAGHLGPRAQARVAARHVPSLRLGAAWPLPRRLLEAFLTGRREVLVLEEGDPFLERELQAIAQSAGIPCRVRGLEGRRPLRLDDDRLEAALRRLGAAVDDVRPHERTLAEWKVARETIASLPAVDMEPWPLFFARARAKLWGFSPADPRAQLLTAIRALPRPTVIVADPSAPALLGFRDRMIDVKAGFGQAPSIAAALAEAQELEEHAGSPLCIALLGEMNFMQSSLLGIIDNKNQGRDVLHVIIVRDATAGSGVVSQQIIEGQLRGLELPYLVCRLGDPALVSTLATMASETGPRALVCIGAQGREEAIGG